VGSYETLYWHKKWIPIKKALKLSNEQRSLIIGSLLGDGTMRIGKGALNANCKIEHGLLQKEYVDWKYSILRPFVYTEPKISYRYTDDKEKYSKSWWFRTIRHPEITDIYREFYTGDEYRTGRKIIPLKIGEYFNALVLAVWIMDDGSYNKKRTDISTYSFSLGEIELLSKCLDEKFGVTMKWYRDRDIGYRMYCSKCNTERLVSIIEPYIIPSMRYKIGFVTP
jgi:hypothetical protein